jgi:predicted metal-dependent enzyme (double-stranded beta helix superfamily)
MSFNLDQFINSCKSAVEADKPQKAISELVQDAVNDYKGVIDAIGEPKHAMVEKIYVADNLTIIHVVWAPKMMLMPHNHNTWAIIGVYAGREDNIFWRRIPDDKNGRIEAAGAKSIATGEVARLGKNIVHSVTNPTSSFTGAIHVYGGNFFEIERSEWDPMSLNEGVYDVEKNLAIFEAENSIVKYRNAADQGRFSR